VKGEISPRQSLLGLPFSPLTKEGGRFNILWGSTSAFFCFRHALLDQMNGDPDLWFRTREVHAYDEARAEVADFLGADVGNLTFVANACTGLSIVLKNLALVRRCPFLPSTILSPFQTSPPMSASRASSSVGFAAKANFAGGGRGKRKASLH